MLLQASRIISCNGSLKTTTRCIGLIRSLSTTQSPNGLVEAKIEDGKNVATLILKRPPVNSLSLEMCSDISHAIKEIEANKKVQAVVLASSNPAILSAGLDLTELYNPDKERLPKFWESFQQVFLDLYGSRLAVIGAIEGHAPAAGCMLAMACDYRVMASSGGDGNGDKKKHGTIGLNEAQFGIAAPPWLGQLMIRTIGFREGEEALTLGTLFSPEDALSIGLVDKVVEGDVVLDACYDAARKFTKIPPQARFASKMLARKEYLDDLVDNRDADTAHFCNFILNDAVQLGLGAYLGRLKRK